MYENCRNNSNQKNHFKLFKFTIQVKLLRRSSHTYMMSYDVSHIYDDFVKYKKKIHTRILSGKVLHNFFMLIL